MALQWLFKFREKSDTVSVKPFLDHLEDLRWMLMKSVITLGVAMCASFAFRKQLIEIVQRPLGQVNEKLLGTLYTFGITDSMTISFHLAFYAGLVISFPLLLYFLAQFVLPALTRQEKKYVLPAISIGFALFLGGVLLSYFFILPLALGFFLTDAISHHLNPMWGMRDYISFVTQLTLAFGLAAELPVAVMTLVYLEFVTFAFLNRTRAYAAVIILALALVISPTPDLLTWFALAAPMGILYEMCIWLAWLVERRKRRRLVVE